MEVSVAQQIEVLQQEVINIIIIIYVDNYLRNS
jgi:hypothetical protein